MANLVGNSNDPNVAAVYGDSTGGPAIWGNQKGDHPNASGVFGTSEKGVGVWGKGGRLAGMFEGDVEVARGRLWANNIVNNPNASAVLGTSQYGVGVWGKGGRLAGMFEGNVQVTGDILLSNADCAEDFDVFEADTIEPGTVMIFGEEDSLQQSQYAYDKRVVGVISGAGNYKPGIILDKQESRMNRKPVALMGKVYCKVDASYASIEVGDLLTTSDTPGHAMKANDPLKSFGTVIGKAMKPIKEGQGLIPILVALQ